MLFVKQIKCVDFTQKMCDNLRQGEKKMLKLKDWIEKSGKSIKEVAEDLKCNYEDIRRYCAGEVIPRPDRMAKIVDYTGGEVQPNDFYEE